MTPGSGEGGQTRVTTTPEGTRIETTDSTETVEPVTGDDRPGHGGGLEDRAIGAFLRSFPWLGAIATGLVAFIVGGFLVAAVLQVDLLIGEGDLAATVDRFVNAGLVGGEDVEPDQPGTYFLSGWAIYAAHFVAIELMGGIGGALGAPVNLLASGAEELVIPQAIYHGIPVAILTVSGAVFVKRTIGTDISTQRAIIAGGAITVGYLPVVAVGSLLFDRTIVVNDIALTYGVPLMGAVVIAGLLLPIVFGGLGGYLAHRYGSDTRE